MKPQPKHFPKDSPCTKRDLWTCFAGPRGGFKSVQVDIAHSIIGLNAPRYMEKQSYLVKETVRSSDMYRLTAAGQQWLTVGILAYVRNHPSEASEIQHLPSPTGRVRTTEPQAQEMPRARRVRPAGGG